METNSLRQLARIPGPLTYLFVVVVIVIVVVVVGTAAAAWLGRVARARSELTLSVLNNVAHSLSRPDLGDNSDFYIDRHTHTCTQTSTDTNIVVVVVVVVSLTCPVGQVFTCDAACLDIFPMGFTDCTERKNK